MPIGVLIRADRPTIIRLPTMALRKPPPSLPGAGVSWVKIAADRPPNPLASKVHKIQLSTARPIDIASTDNAMPMRWLRKRLR